MGYLAAFLEGIVTFVSPCLLPLLPVYLAFFAGGADQLGADGRALGAQDRLPTLAGACLFVVGFTVPFTLMGAFAGSLAGFLLAHQRLLDVACGAIVMVMGVNYLGLLPVSPFGRGVGMASAGRRPGAFGSLLLGLTFAVTWSPCVGTFLASALSLAASAGGTLRGMAMLVSYSLGLGLPFVLSAVFIDQVETAAGWVKAHYDLVNRACGFLLLLVGALMATGAMGTWMRLVSAS